MYPPVYLLLMTAEIVEFPPPGTGFIVDQVGNFISDQLNEPILYAE